MITGYIINKETGKIESYYEFKEQPKNTDKHEFVQCDKDKLPVIEQPAKEPMETTEQLIERKIKEMVSNTALKAEVKAL